MRIRYLLITAIVLAFALVAARLVLLQVRSAQDEQLDRAQLNVDAISRDAASLLVLSQDYLLHASPRAARQWRAVQAELALKLPLAAADAADLQDELAVLGSVAQRLPALFDAVRSVTDGAKPGETELVRRDLLAGHLVAQTRRISDGAFDIASELAETRREGSRIDLIVTRATMALFATLVLCIAFVLHRRVLRPMARMELAARALRGGDAAARNGYRAKDEFGSLSRTFDQMADALQQRTAGLEAARQEVQAVLDAVPSEIAYWDRSLHNRFANPAYLAWFGLDRQALSGAHISILGAIYETSLPQIEAVLRGQPQVFELTLHRVNGGGRSYAVAHYLPDIVDGEVRGFYCCMHDMTQQSLDKARLAAALRDNEALLSTIRLHTIFSVADVGGRIVEANDNFCRITGYSREELLGQNHRIVNSGVQDDAFWVDMWRTIASGRPWRGEVCNRAKNGSLYWVDSIIAPFVGAAGRIDKYISIRTDITAAKLAEQRLRASEAFLDRVGRVAGVGGWTLDIASGTVGWTSETCRLMDMPVGHLPSLEEAVAFYTPEARPLITAVIEKAMADGSGWDMELPLVTATGRSIWVRVIGEVEMEDGRAKRLVGAFQDVSARRALESERQQAETLIQLAHDRFSIAADSAMIGVWEYDIALGRITWDDRMFQLYRRERSADSEPYALWAENVHPDDRAESEDALQAAIRGERDFDPEFRIRWPDGQVRHLKANARVVRDGTGTALRMTGINIDITERKQAELELMRTSALLRSVLDSSSEVSIIATDPQLDITVFNVGAQRLLGYSSQEVVARATPILIHDPVEVEARGRALSEQLGRTVEGGAVFTEPSTLQQPHEWTYVRKDGGRIPVSLVVTAMHGADGTLTGYLGIAHDVTQQRAHEESLRAAMHQARHASLAKSQFLANMSHEIRTPMNAVIGLSYLLGETALDATQEEYLAKIRLASKSLMAVINDILDLSKVEAGELTIEHAPFQLRHLLRDLGDVMGVHAQAKSIGLKIDAPYELPEVLDGDAARLSQILTNLLANAIKFTESGGVKLLVRQVGTGDGGVRLRFAVQDSGIGIAPEVQSRLFTPFAQADTSITRRFGGTGLGLSIVKRLANLMGGTVSLHSTLGAGSEFAVELPFTLATPEALMPPPAPVLLPGERALPGVKVLVADDSDINLEVALRILELEGAEVTLAGNGREAFELLQAGPQDFDLVLMDVQMPVLDGYEATRSIRNELGLTALPILALTAGALTSERQRAADAGMNDFVSKPFDPRQLVLTVRRHVRRELRDVPGSRRASRGRAAAVAQARWPVIEGIDATDAHARLGGDLDLFRLMLARVLREFADIDAAAGPKSDSLPALAARLHKLKGGAGSLGMTAVHACAGAAEAACRAGDALGAQRLVADLAGLLRRVRERAADFFDEAVARDRKEAAALAANNDDGPADPQILVELAQLLREQNLSALERFSATASQLRRLLGPTTYEAVREHIDNLQFDAAVAALESCPLAAAA